MMNRIMETLREEEGATMVEYALMVALIAVLCIAAIGTLREGIIRTFTGAAGQMP